MTLTLPDFPVNLVYADAKQSDNFIQLTTTLPDYLQAQPSGLILYFYPKDNTAGCSVQAQDFSEHQATFANLGYQILGVSRDSIKSHERFITAKQITFPLISDSDETLCRHFGVIGEKMMYGKKVQGVVRSTFIFDKMGTLQQALTNVRAKGHVESLLTLLQQS